MSQIEIDRNPKGQKIPGKVAFVATLLLPILGAACLVMPEPCLLYTSVRGKIRVERARIGAVILEIRHERALPVEQLRLGEDVYKRQLQRARGASFRGK